MPTSLDLPEHFGKYRLLHELGRGGMGVVYLAEDKRLQRRVALKVLYTVITSHGSHAALEREARLLASLEHPNVVRVHSLEEIEGRIAIDMEYIDGPSAAALAGGGGVALAPAMRILHDCLHALMYCEDRGVVHRDIKPGNILLKSSGVTVLSDFGLATSYLDSLEKVVEVSASANILFGTPRYIPPEAWEGAEPNSSWDIYALGLVFYELLAGRPLIEGTTALSVARALLQPRHASISESGMPVSPELARVMDRMVALNPAERIQDAAEALAALRETPELNTLPDLPTIRTSSLRRRRKPRRHARVRKPWPLVGLAAVLAIVLGFAWYFLRPPETAAPAAPAASAAAVEPEESAQAPAPRLETLLRERIVSREEIASSAAGESGTEYIIGTASVVGEAGVESLQCLLTRRANQQHAELVGFDEDSLWRLYLQRGMEAQWHVSGGWASYGGPEGGGVRHGTCRGAATGNVPGEVLVATLRVRNELTNEEQAATLQLVPGPQEVTYARFLLQLESAPAVTPLLYRELLPRRLPWAAEVDAMLPLLPDSRLSLTPSGGAVEAAVDGQLTERYWTGAEQLPAHPSGQHCTLVAAVAGDALQLGLRVPLTVGKPEVKMSFAPFLTPPVQLAPRYHLEWTEEGLAHSEYRRGEGTGEWRCPWPSACARTAEAWQLELAVPLSQMGWLEGLSQLPQARLNVQVLDATASPAELLFAWGYPDLNATEHGVLLELKR